MWRAASRRSIVTINKCCSHFYSTQKPVWGFISDTHFQEQSLDKIVAATDWIVEEFTKKNVNRVFLLGDILNTRQMVHIGAQSAAMNFINKLFRTFDSNIQVIIGNHDMHLRHSRAVTSLDSLDLSPLSERISLYREFTITEIDGYKIVMIPYHQNEAELEKKIVDLQNQIPEAELEQMIALAHVSVSSACVSKSKNILFEGFILNSDSFRFLD